MLQRHESWFQHENGVSAAVCSAELAELVGTVEYVAANPGQFFKEKKPAAVVKHGVLGHYIKLFSTMLGSKSAAVWVIDAYAGPGEYAQEVDTPAEPGSPKILCGVANAARNTEVHGVFIEPDADYVAQLRKLVAQEGKPGQHKIYHGTAEKHLGNAVAGAGTAPLLIFLDPFGAGLAFDTLVSCVQGRPKGTITEILLNFNVEAIWRIGGYLTSKHQKLTESDALRVVDDFVGGDWWRKVFLDARGSDGRGSAADAAQAVAGEFNRRMNARLGLRAFTVPIRRRPTQKPIFLLTLYFGNETAAWAFAESASSANERLRKHLKRVDDAVLPTNTLFSLAELQEESDAAFKKREVALEAEWIGIISENIRSLAGVETETRVREHAVAIYGTTLGSAREKHIRAAWDALATQGVVQDRDKSMKRLRDGVIRPREQ